MKVDRRQFNALALSALATAIGPGGEGVALAASSQSSLSVKTLNRLTFGASPQSIASFEAIGKKAWLAEQLSLPVTDADLTSRLAAARLHIEYEAGDSGIENSRMVTSWPARNEDIPFQYLDADPLVLLQLTDFETTHIDWEERVRPSREVQSAMFIRATHARAQLREVMTQFWHDHFNVNSQRDEMTAAFFPQYDKMLRQNALGNFRQMLGEVARSPAMLFYLNNEASQASPANENFARELLELHTLGAPNYVNGQYESWAEVPGAQKGRALGYLDEDVYEVARAFTGWTFGDGRYLQEGDSAPVNGQFHYVDSWHDPYQKRILGVEFGPNNGPMEDGERVLDLLASHPGTAHYVCEKICRRLFMDQPPAGLIKQAAATFLANVDQNDQLAQVVQTIVLSDVFDATPARKLKRPMEFLVSLFRASEAHLHSPSYDLVYFLANTGWRQHEFRPPTGHPDSNEDWANTSALNGMINLAMFGLGKDLIGSEMDFVAIMGSEIKTWGAALTFWFERFNGVADPTQTAHTLLGELDVDPNDPLPGNQDDLDWPIRTVIGLSALTPGFLFR